MLKTFIKFSLIVIFAQIVSYYFGGIISQVFLGAKEFYPPSATAIFYLKDPRAISQLLILGGQALRGLLFAAVLFPFRGQILKLGTWRGGFLITAVIFLVGYIAASGGMIEHFIYFKPEDYPVKFAVITFFEILIQTVIMGPLVVRMDKKFNPSY